MRGGKKDVRQRACAGWRSPDQRRSRAFFCVEERSGKRRGAAPWRSKPAARARSLSLSLPSPPVSREERGLCRHTPRLTAACAWGERRGRGGSSRALFVGDWRRSTSEESDFLFSLFDTGEKKGGRPKLHTHTDKNGKHRLGVRLIGQTKEAGSEESARGGKTEGGLCVFPTPHHHSHAPSAAPPLPLPPRTHAT